MDIQVKKPFLTRMSSLHINVHINKVIKPIGNVAIFNQLAVFFYISIFNGKKLNVLSTFIVKIIRTCYEQTDNNIQSLIVLNKLFSELFH